MQVIVKRIDIVVPHCKTVDIGDVVVHPREDLVALPAVCEWVVRSWIVPVFVDQDILKFCRTIARDQRDVGGGDACTREHDIRRSSASCNLSIQEEEEVVLDDRSTYPETGLIFAELGNFRVRYHGCQPYLVLIPTKPECGTGKGVCSAPRDCIHSATGEATLPDIIRRDDYLKFLDGVKADRLRVRLPARCPGRTEPEQVVHVGSVDLYVIEPVVTPGSGIAVELRTEILKRREATGDCRESLEDFFRNVRRRTRPGIADHCTTFRNHGHFRELHRLFNENKINLQVLAEQKVDVLFCLRLVAHCFRRNLVGTADTHAGDVESAIVTSIRAEQRSARHMRCRDDCTWNRLPFCISDNTVDCRSGYSLRKHE